MIGDEIEAQLNAWMRRQDAAPPLTAVVQIALKEFPSRKGSGSHDISVAHDRYLAGK
jgi:hypothetical protein